MCNPPFYSSKEEIEKSKTEKELSPSAVCTGAETEMITPGGESAFVQQMVTESLIYGTKCRSVPLSEDFRSGCKSAHEIQMVHVHARKTFFPYRRRQFVARKRGKQIQPSVK